MVVVLVVQLKEDKDVVGQPADEESKDECSHDFERFGVLGHPVGSKFEDDDGVAEDDDDERDNETCNEATHCNYAVTVVV